MRTYEKIHSDENRRFCCEMELEFEKYVGTTDINVYTNEGPIPHFHIESKSEGFDCCICIFEAYYFSHGSHTDTLNSKQKKQLDNFLSEKSKFNRKLSNWEFIRDAWISANHKTDGISDYPMSKPNYRYIDTYCDR